MQTINRVPSPLLHAKKYCFQDIKADLDGNVSRFAGFNAVQIVGDLTPAAAVPEPSSLIVMLGTGIAGLARRKRS